MAVLRLQASRRMAAFGVPLLTLGIATVVSFVIQIILLRSGVYESSDAAVGLRANPAVAYALSGYLVSYGVQSTAGAFPLASSFGTTRRDFALGTTLMHVVLAVFVTAVFTAMLGLELATGHWGAGFYVFDIDVLGAGDVLTLIPVVFLGTMVALALGGLFGAAWLRFGSRGPLGLSIAVVVLIAVLALVLEPSFGAIAEAFRVWWLAVLAMGLTVVAIAGMTGFLRRASVR
ncbi:hypothetical protein ACPEEZ_14350 [Frigoribacterium sp. 2-23]|uniref:hypothetical protein n=1 Tax=Frigoribacterium sp. 2-23 TaxID=3415006 RepID=UPI003C6EC8E7